MKNNHILWILLTVVVILLIPLALTIVNPAAHINGGSGGGWDWSPLDFIFAFVLLSGAGVVYDLLARKAKKPSNRLWIGLVIGLIVLFIWAQAAVGAVSQVIDWILG